MEECKFSFLNFHHTFRALAKKLVILHKGCYMEPMVGLRDLGLARYGSLLLV